MLCCAGSTVGLGDKRMAEVAFKAAELLYKKIGCLHFSLNFRMP